MKVDCAWVWVGTTAFCFILLVILVVTGPSITTIDHPAPANFNIDKFLGVTYHNNCNELNRYLYSDFAALGNNGQYTCAWDTETWLADCCIDPRVN